VHTITSVKKYVEHRLLSKSSQATNMLTYLGYLYRNS